MTRRDPIHPVLAGRPRRFLIASMMIVAVTGCMAAGYYGIVASRGLPGISVADAQASGSETRDSRLVADKTAAQPAAPELHSAVSRQAAEWGAKTCLAQIGQVSDFLTKGLSYSALSRKAPAGVEGGIFSATIAGKDKAGLSSVSTFVSAPVGGDNCNSAYQTVAAFADNCEQTRRSRFAGFDDKVDMGGAESWTNGKGAYLHMLSLGDRGCVIVKTELLF